MYEVNYRGDRKTAEVAQKRFLVVVPTDIKNSGGSVVRPRVVSEEIGSRWSSSLFWYKGHKTGMPSWKFVLFAPFWSLSLASAIIRYDYDCVYFYLDKFGFLIAYVLRRLAFRRYRLVFDVLSVTHDREGNPLDEIDLTGLRRFAVCHADLVIACSHSSAQFLRRYNPDVTLVRTFVIDRSPLKRTRDEIRSMYNISQDDVVVGMVGPFDSPNNVGDIRYLNRHIHAFDPRVRFLIIGTVPSKERIESGQVTYTGYVSDYMSHVASLDCLLIPRRVPPDGVVDGAMNREIEAISTGVPVFTSLPGLSVLEFGEPGKNMIVFDLENPGQIRKVLLDRRTLHELGLQAYSTFRDHYSKEGEKLLIALEQLVNS
ncbi:MAG: glycosyltransferase family 4 protein [Nitrososphaerota archaeon]|nr:glycosyltransferase family 4 protein [Nitrososphaerota archaeon]